MRFVRLLVVCCAVSGIALPLVSNKAMASAIGSPIIFDTFTALNGTNLIGWAPDVANMPGGTYGNVGSSGWQHDIQGNQASPGADIGFGVSLQSAGSYSKPSLLIMSADINVGNTTDDGFPTRVLGVGYYSTVSPSAGHCCDNFTGLSTNRAGMLRLIVDGGDGGLTAPYTGTFDPNANHSLSYAVNLLDGSIYNVLFDGQPKAFSTNVFTNARTQNAGFFVSSSSGGPRGFIDNFLVVPEPSCVTLGALAAVALAFVRGRARR